MLAKRTKIAAMTAIALLAACTSVTMYRSDTRTRCEYGPGNENFKRDCAVHEIGYEYGEDKKSSKVSLGFIEFDDFGWLHKHEQVDAVLKYIREKQLNEADGQKGALIFVYIHGWLNNAQIGNENVGCFTTTLKMIDRIERAAADSRMLETKKDDGTIVLVNQPDAPRHVIGVYLGWRGKSLVGWPLEYLSFWDRKTTAEHVGVAAITEVLTRLDDLKNDTDKTRREGYEKAGENDRAKNLLVLLGHSFGGQVLFRATSQFLMANAAVPAKDQPMKGYGDLVVLINPALEAAQYMPLFETAIRQEYSQRQRPVLVGVTTNADDATGFWFPLGRWITFISGLSESVRSDRFVEQFMAHQSAVGHFRPFRTHDAAARNGKSTGIKTGHIDCPQIDPDWVDGNGPSFKNLTKREQSEAFLTLQDPRIETTHTDQTRILDHFPFHMVYTDESVILDHSDYFSLEFLSLLFDYYVRGLFAERRHNDGLSENTTRK